MRKCSIEGCKRKVRARGLCDKHYLAWWDGKVPGYYLTNGEMLAKPLRSDNLCKPNFSQQRAMELAALIKLLPASRRAE